MAVHYQNMKRLIIPALLAVSFVMAGCQTAEPTAETPTDAATGQPSQATTEAPMTEAGNGGNLGVTTGAAGAAAPVTNAPNFSAGAGGVGQAAKDSARRAVGSVGSGSASQLNTEGTGE